MDIENYKELDEALERLDESAEELEVLNEIALASGKGYSLNIDPTVREGRGFYLDPYVKVYDAERYSKAKNCLRVHIITGRCEHHNDAKGGLPISREIKKFLHDYLTQQVYDYIFELMKIEFLPYWPNCVEEIDKLHAEHKEVFDFNNIYWGGGKERQYRRIK